MGGGASFEAPKYPEAASFSCPLWQVPSSWQSHSTAIKSVLQVMLHEAGSIQGKPCHIIFYYYYFPKEKNKSIKFRSRTLSPPLLKEAYPSRLTRTSGQMESFFPRCPQRHLFRSGRSEPMSQASSDPWIVSKCVHVIRSAESHGAVPQTRPSCNYIRSCVHL